jgi:hypothetical protein
MGLGRKLEEHTYRLLDSAVIISNPSVTPVQKQAALDDMSNGSDRVLVYLRLAFTTKELDGKRYQILSGKVLAIGRQVGGLKKYFDRRSGTTKSF